MTPKELADKTIEDIIIRRLKAENEFYGYEADRSVKRKKSWNINFGGYRW